MWGSLRTPFRSTERLSPLAILHNHGRKDVDVDRVIYLGGMDAPIPPHDCMWIRDTFEVVWSPTKLWAGEEISIPKKSRFGFNTFTGCLEKRFKGMKFYYILLGNYLVQIAFTSFKISKTPLEIRVFSAQCKENVHSKKQLATPLTRRWVWYHVRRRDLIYWGWGHFTSTCYSFQVWAGNTRPCLPALIFVRYAYSGHRVHELINI